MPASNLLSLPRTARGRGDLGLRKKDVRLLLVGDPATLNSANVSNITFFFFFFF